MTFTCATFCSPRVSSPQPIEYKRLALAAPVSTALGNCSMALNAAAWDFTSCAVSDCGAAVCAGQAQLLALCGCGVHK